MTELFFIDPYEGKPLLIFKKLKSNYMKPFIRKNPWKIILKDFENSWFLLKIFLMHKKIKNVNNGMFNDLYSKKKKMTSERVLLPVKGFSNISQIVGGDPFREGQ